MKFTGDKNKNKTNIEKHSFSFDDAIQVFFDKKALIDNSLRNGELRKTIIGMSDKGVLFVVYVELVDDTFRIISVRRANKKERAKYEDQ